MQLFHRYIAVWTFLGVILLALLIWPELAIDLLNSSGFEPHGACFQWRGDILTLHVTADTLIGVSYMGISGYLVGKVWRFRTSFGHLPAWLAAAFGGFIFFCGLTHFMGVAVLWYPFYWLDGGLKTLTAFASIGTFAGLLVTNRKINFTLIALRQRDELHEENLIAITQLQAALHSKDENLVSLTEEITRQRRERTKLIAELKQSNERQRRVFEANPAAKVITLAETFQILDCNPAFEHLTGWSRAEVVGKDSSELALWAESANRAKSHQHLAAGKNMIDYPMKMRTRSGELHDLRVSVVPIEQDGKPAYLTVMIDDTAQSKLFRQLQHTRDQLLGIMYTAMDAIITIGEDQRIILFNRAAEQMFGYTAQEVVGQHVGMLMPERYRSAHIEHVKIFGESGVTLRQMGAMLILRGLRRNRSEFSMEASISQLETEGDKLYTVVIRDRSRPVKEIDDA